MLRRVGEKLKKGDSDHFETASRTLTPAFFLFNRGGINGKRGFEERNARALSETLLSRHPFLSPFAVSFLFDPFAFSHSLLSLALSLSAGACGGFRKEVERSG